MFQETVWALSNIQRFLRHVSAALLKVAEEVFCKERYS